MTLLVLRLLNGALALASAFHLVHSAMSDHLR
jgi:hypothetical protein